MSSNLGQVAGNVDVNEKSLSKASHIWRAVDQLQDLLSGVNHHQCPGCAFGEARVHVDGNMKLLTYKTARQSKRTTPSLYQLLPGNIMLSDWLVQSLEKKLDELMGISRKGMYGGNDGRTCGSSHFKKTFDKPISFSKLSTSGVILAGCQHMCVVGGCNLYSDVMLPADALDDVQCIVSGVHALTHAWYCRVRYSPLWRDKAGADDGEFVERDNAHFSRLQNSVKYCSIPEKTERLEESIRDWNAGHVASLGDYLIKRYEHATKGYSSAKAAFEKKVKAASVVLGDDAVTESKLDCWKQEIIAAAEAKHAEGPRALTEKK
jgi:hypothetical protein